MDKQPMLPGIIDRKAENEIIRQRVTDGYPNELLGTLRRFFVETWLKEKAYDYFAERDPNALPYLTEFLALPNYREVMGFIETNAP